MKKLAIYGGPKTINKKFEPYNSLGEEERIAVDKVMRSGILSQFQGLGIKIFTADQKFENLKKCLQIILV